MRKLLSAILLMSLPMTLFCSGNSKINSNIDIVRYVFSITLSDSSDLIRASAAISLVVINPTDSLRFDLRTIRPDGKGMKVSSVTVNSKPAGYSHRNDKLSTLSPLPLSKGDTISLTIAYEGIPADGLLISATRFGNRSFFADHWPDRASHYLPCIDHVADKAAVEFIITAPVHYKVVSNGSLIEESNLPNNLKLTHWREDTPLPVKVMTFGAAEFAVQYAGTGAGVPVWTYVYPENRKEGFSDYALALKPVSYFSELIGPYPFPKLANVQSKTVFGGLENAGAIFYSEGSVTGTGRSEGLIAHEVAHQWFGNSVTEADWHHVWLSEGFATYLTTLYWENLQGTTRLQSDMRAARDRVLRTGAHNSKPVVDTTVTDLMRLLSANSYQKGAWVLHMLRNRIGDEAFFNGLRLYYSRYLNANALTIDFMRVMEEVSRTSLEGFFNQWLFLAGQPDLKCDYTYNQAAGNISLTVIQTQDYLFSFPLEIEVHTERGNTILKLNIDKKASELTAKIAGKPTQVILDPHVKLLFKEIK